MTPRLRISIVLVLAAVVAATAHTKLWGAPRDGVGYASELLTIVALSFVGAFALTAALMPLLRRRASLGASWRAAIPPTLVVASLVGLFGITRTELHFEAAGVTEGTESGFLGTRLRNNWRGTAVRYEPEPDAGADEALPESVGRAVLVRFTLLLLAVLALLLVARMRRSGRRGFSAGPGPSDPSMPVTHDDRLRREAHSAVIRSIDAMLADPDHRTAIIGAYARLLEELEAIDASRRSYEGPTEHLHRVLADLDAPPEALRTLVRLFEVARFSEHALTATHRNDAVAALRTVAASLETPASRRVAAEVGR